MAIEDEYLTKQPVLVIDQRMSSQKRDANAY